MINKVCVLDLDLDLEVITSRLSSNWTRHRLYVELYCQYSCGKLFSVFLIKTLIFLCIFLCFLKILLCFWLCFLLILGLQSPWKHCIWIITSALVLSEPVPSLVSINFSSIGGATTVNLSYIIFAFCVCLCMFTLVSYKDQKLFVWNIPSIIFRLSVSYIPRNDWILLCM